MTYNNNRKRAACFRGTGKNGKPYIRGYSSRRQGKFAFIATPTDSMKAGRTKSGKEFEAWPCKIQPYNKAIPARITTLFFYPADGGFTIPDMNYAGSSQKGTFYPRNWKEIKSRMDSRGNYSRGGNRQYNRGYNNNRNYQ